MSAATIYVTLEAFDAYVRRLAKADWYYEHSDDHSRWQAGKNTMQSLVYFAAEHPLYQQAYDAWHNHLFGTKNTVHRDRLINEIKATLLITA